MVGLSMFKGQMCSLLWQYVLPCAFYCVAARCCRWSCNGAFSHICWYLLDLGLGLLDLDEVLANL